MPSRKKTAAPALDEYRHKDATAAMRPEAGTQPHFKSKAVRQTYRYDSSLSPALDWDGQNAAREQGEQFLRDILEAKDLGAAKAAAAKLQALGRPFLDWAGKAERLSFDVPALPLFIHDRHSAKAIIESLRAHRRGGQQRTIYELFADPQHSIADQHLRAYEHRDPWVNRLILGDNLQVMCSLLHHEKMAGQVQMIYMDPPYGVKFGSNFQPFVRKRDVSHNDDEDLTREPEMVQAYRDTWEVGLHSYLTYLRDRLLIARELLHPTGSMFVQIGETNLHHVRELMDEVFGDENCVSLITYVTTTGSTGLHLPATADYVLFYARDRERLNYRQLYLDKRAAGIADGPYAWLDLDGHARRRMSAEERHGTQPLPAGAKIFRLDNLQSQSGGRDKGDGAACWFPVTHEGREWKPSLKSTWKTNEAGMARLQAAGRFQATSGGLYYVRYLDDFSVQPISNNWDDTSIAGFASDKFYVVQTNSKVIQRCILMTTDPGDLVLDPTCGGGTTAYVAEQWGRRWISIDVSRVPLALARQRLLTATFPWYQLKDEARGPAGGFVYKRRQNRRGEEVGGIVPHVTLRSIANNEPPDEEVLVDRPEAAKDIVRVSGPFTIEATIAPSLVADADADKAAVPTADDRSYPERMLAVLRRSPRLALPGNRAIEFANARLPARAQTISAEAALLNGKEGPVAVVFGPEHGAVSERLVYAAAKEANAKNYVHLVVIGFAVEAKARQLIENCEAVCGLPATYAQATPDVTMGDLLKNMRSSQVLSVCGLPEVAVTRLPAVGDAPERFQVTLLGVDVFNPITMEVYHRKGDDVPAWFLCADYQEHASFLITQAFFPRTAAWDNVKRSLKATYEDSLWDHLAGTTSAPFEAGPSRTIAVKVIDDRGNELLVVKRLDEAAPPKSVPQSGASRVTKGRGRKR